MTNIPFAQTREVECTRIDLSKVMNRGWIVFVVICHNIITSHIFQDEVASLEDGLLYKESRDKGSTPDHAWRTVTIGLFL